MRSIFLVLIIVSLTMAQRPATPKGRQLLLDFRADHNPADVKITPATQRHVLSKLFRRYLTDQTKCNGQFDAGNADDPLAAARKAGQIVPLISDVATGSFTVAGQSQTAYVISVGECNASHADNNGTKRVAIFAGQQLVADFDADFKITIERHVDLNGDGVDELVMSGGDMGQGTLIMTAALVSFQNGRLRVIEDFGTVVEDDCGSGRPGSTTRASALYFSTAAPGALPKLIQDNFVSSCRNTKRWKFVSSKAI
jgi:hypothetical protein